jgi:hypothetical protein
MGIVVTIATVALVLMIVFALVAPWLGGTARFVLFTLAAVLFGVLVVWSPVTLTNAVVWLGSNWWWLILIVVEFILGIVLKRNSA